VDGGCGIGIGEEEVLGWARGGEEGGRAGGVERGGEVRIKDALP